MFHLGRSHSSGLPDGSPSVGLDLHCLQDRRTPSGALVTNHSQATAASDHTSALQGDQCVIVSLSEILVRASFVLGSLRALCPGLLGAISDLYADGGAPTIVLGPFLSTGPLTPRLTERFVPSRPFG